MPRTIVTRTINARPEIVFQTVTDISRFSQAIPHITKVEFLSETKIGVGTRFRETRLMNGKEAATDLEVTEYVEYDHVRIISDTHGTVWDTLFTVKPVEAGAELVMVMEARAHKFLPRIMNPLVLGFIKKAIEADMDCVKDYCESGG